ncbi:MAG: phenylacetate--CoA ligase [Nitrospiraceae bacterium]|jgi:phenylacetate-CoA ligase|nr:phenylacetate--CoA ligase [Nitrospiraceae bacterium]
MSKVRYWQKDIETIGRRALEELQLKRLRSSFGRLYRHVPSFREKCRAAGVSPAAINSLRDIAHIPFTTSDDLRAGYPAGLLAVDRNRAIRLHTSSGTTGKPKAIFFSKRDIAQAAELVARCLTMTGTGSGDVLQNMMTYGLFTGALMMHYGAEKVGALVIPAGPGNTERQIALMQDFGTTAVHILPSYALYLATFMQQHGMDPKKDLSLKRAYMGAEPYSEKTRLKIEKLFGIDVYNCYGLTEMNGPGVAFECLEKNGLHLWEDNFIVEIVDPVTGQQLPEGAEGELVLTSLCREAMPVMRYRTRDITRILAGKCPCGRTHRRISRILGRSDDMIIVRGVNIFPQQIEQVLMGIRGVAQNYQIVLESLDELTIRVEIARDMFDGNIEHLLSLKSEIVEKIRSAVLVKPIVELLEPGTLPVTEGKAKRVIDKRTI